MATDLLRYCLEWLERGIGRDLPMKTALFLLKLHYNHFVASGGAEGNAILMEKLWDAADKYCSSEKDIIGFNQAASR